jgi:hypothetical protein
VNLPGFYTGVHNATPTIINPYTAQIVVAKHCQPCHAHSLSLVTLYYSLDFPKNIAINYRAPSQYLSEAQIARRYRVFEPVGLSGFFAVVHIIVIFS